MKIEERESICKVPENMPNMHVSYIIIIITPLPTSFYTCLATRQHKEVLEMKLSRHYC